MEKKRQVDSINNIECQVCLFRFDVSCCQHITSCVPGLMFQVCCFRFDVLCLSADTILCFRFDVSGLMFQV